MEENTSITIKKNSLLKYSVFIILIVSVIGIFMLVNADGDTKNNSATGNTVNTESNGDVQKITLGTKNYNYYPDTITVKAGKPVEITLDKSVYGCLRSFTIRDLGISGYSRSPDETIDFTPTEKGTFKFSCSMGMGYGTFIVE